MYTLGRIVTLSSKLIIYEGDEILLNMSCVKEQMLFIRNESKKDKSLNSVGKLCGCYSADV